MSKEIRPGAKVKVIWLSNGEAVYNKAGKVINAHWKPVETIATGLVKRIERECGFGVIVVKCEGEKGPFNFYPKDTGLTQIVEVLA